MIGQIAGNVLGMIGQNARANKQNARQKQLMGIQFENQKKLNQQGHDLQMKMWKDTNYPAQVKMLEEAGLNAGLLYGQGGAGGATTGSQGGGSAAGGQAHAPMDIGQALQAGMMKAQIDNINADTELKKEQAPETKMRGWKQYLENVIQEWKMDDPNKILTVYNKTYKGAGMTPTSLEGRQQIAETEKIEQTADQIEKSIEVMDIEKAAKNMGIDLDKAKMDKITHEIIQGYISNGIQILNSFQLQEVIKKALGLGKKK